MKNENKILKIDFETTKKDYDEEKNESIINAIAEVPTWEGIPTDDYFDNDQITYLGNSRYHVTSYIVVEDNKELIKVSKNYKFE